MVREVNQNYGIWLAGYYDDFTGSRAIPNDNNAPSLSDSYDHLKTHFGNPMNGEATLNPKYRWSFADRKRSIGGSYVSSTTDKLMSNKGIFEWVTLDTTRQDSNRWAGRAQLQYPDGHIANTYKYAGNGSTGVSDFYQLLCASYDTSKHYAVATGDNDATFGRANMKSYTESNFELAGGYSVAGQMASSTGNFVQRAHLAGVWAGEQFRNSEGSADWSHTGAYNTFANLTSPAKTPFLCVQSYHTQHDSSSSRKVICYDSPLNSRLNEDIFTIRLAVRSFGVGTGSAKLTPRVTLELGGNSSTVTNKMNGFDNPVVSYQLDLSGYDTHPMKYNWGTSNVATTTAASYNNDDSWIDLDILLDYDNNQYKVYQDGVLKQTTSSFTITPEQLHGWQIKAVPPSSHSTPSIINVMIDRVALYHPLTDHVDGREIAPISKFELATRQNGSSQCQFDVMDDKLNDSGTSITDYSHQFKNIFMSSSIADWKILFFPSEMGAARIDRPFWQGIISKIDITQAVVGGRKAKIEGIDYISQLDKIIPMWQIGQDALDNDADGNAYWLYDSKGFNEVMNMGVRELKDLKPTVGFDKDDSYVELLEQRTQLGSGHPIQMYVNEDVFGPNNIEDAYDGVGVLGFHERYGNSQQQLCVTLNGTGYWSSGAVTITNANNAAHNIVAKTPQATADVNGNQVLYFDEDVYVAETAKIQYAGKYKPYIYDADTWANEGAWQNIVTRSLHPVAPHNETDKTHFILSQPSWSSSDTPPLQPGDTFMVSKLVSGTGTTNQSGVDYLFNVQHKVVSIIKSGNYFDIHEVGGGISSYVWVIETDTDYGGAEFGDYINDDLKVLGSDLEWCKDTAQTDLVPELGKAANRAVHARWLRDIADSLWFKYHFGQIQRVSAGADSIKSSVLLNANSIHISNSGDNSTYTGASNSGGIAQLYHPKHGYTTFIYKGKHADGNNRYLVGCQYVSKTYPTTAMVGGPNGVNFATEVRLLNVQSDYKHIWLLWSDMRNNGKADADGGSKKQDFGLIFPTSKNYNLKLRFADQFNVDGTPDDFTELKSESDYLIWNVDSTNDPSTGGAFSKPVNYTNYQIATSISEQSTKLRITHSDHTVSVGDYIAIYNTNLHDGVYKVESVGQISGDNETFDMAAGTYKGSDSALTGGIRYAPVKGSHIDETKYKNWEDKAGAFALIDTSPFFNLNTLANGGRTGQAVGLKTGLGDYVATVSGFPMLIDNYYLEAMSSYKTTNAPFENHPNDRRLNVEATLLTKDILENENYIIGEDFTDFPSSGFGRLTGRKGEGSNQQIAERFFTWSAKTSTTISETIVTSADSTYYGDKNYGTGNIVGKKIIIGKDMEALGVEVGSLLIHNSIKYTISAIVTTVSTNDSLIINRIMTNQELQTEVNDEFANILWIEAGNSTYGWPMAIGNSNFLNIWEGFHDISGVTFNSTTFTILPQLNYVWTTSINNLSASVLDSPFAVENELGSLLSNLPVQARRIDMGMAIEGETPQFDEITITSSVSSQYMLRLMMKLEGQTKSPNIGTYYESDKFRMLWNSALVDNWMPPTALPFTYSFNNVPQTTKMTYDGTLSNTDEYGSTLDARNSSFMQILKGITDNSGIGKEGNVTKFSHLQGRDGKFEFRPKYNSGIAFNRDNVILSNMSMDMTKTIDRVRIYYADGASFVDYPKDASPYVSTAKWEVIEEPQIKQHHEALALAEAEYNTLKSPKLRLSLTPTLDRLDEEPMLTGGRYGYVSDPQVALQGRQDIDDDSSQQPANRHHAWTFLGTGGVPYPGMVNALDGNQKTTTDIYARYGVSEQETTTADTAYNDNFYWYGANSLSNALSCVHVPKRCPYVSDTTSNELRLFVALKSGQSGTDIDNAEFTIGIIDYQFSGSAGTGPGGPTLAHTVASGSGTKYTTLDVKENGFYEITIPNSYSSSLHDAGAKFVFSFNADYCRSLLQHRCGNPNGSDILKNAHNIEGISFTGTNTDSIFPLGLRNQDIHSAGFSGTRVGYYAPRLQIIPDFTYIPSTFVTLTDAGLNLNNESLVITDCNYSIQIGKIDVKLSLEKDESKKSESIISYLFPTPPPPPPIVPMQVQHMLGPPGPITGGTDPNALDNMPAGDGSQGFVTADPSVVVNQAGSGMNTNSINTISVSAYDNLTGRMGLSADQFTAQGEFALLGQKKVGLSPSVMKGANEFSDMIIDGGSAIRSLEGWSLPPTGNSPSDEGQVFHRAKVSRTVSVPSDVTTEEVAVTALITLGDRTPSSGVAKLNVRLECLDTGAKHTRNVTIPASTVRKNISFMSNTNLDGASKTSNRIKVTITRRDATEDTSDDSVIIHNLDVQFRRAGMQGKSASGTFRPYQ